MSTTTAATTTVSVLGLREILSAVRSATPVTLTALTVPEQKVNPYGRIRKLVRINAMTGCRWENAKARAAGKPLPTDPKPLERAWGERDESAVVTKVKDGVEVAYLPVQINHASQPLYLIEDPTTRRLRQIPEADVRAYVRAERPFSYKDYRLDNLLAINLRGRKLRVRATAAAVLSA